ncbi:MAG: hypothetical protein BBJ60_00060 [Desulfobacterales bacterium S7086C20]|nr:MAG: hypothetical protein BBJ60_00060 [Desulfobacterales bacterium S7086C20]
MASFKTLTEPEISGDIKYRAPTFRKMQSGFTPAPGAFDVSNTPLFQQAERTATEQLAGNVEGFDTQSTIARETAKAVQAQTAKATRERLMQMGQKDTGTFVEQGFVQPAEAQRRERLDLERRLATTRGELSMQQKQIGQTSAANLLNITQAGDRLTEEGRQFDVGLAEQARQFDTREAFDRWALQKGLGESERNRVWQSEENRRQIVSTEKLGFADLNFREKGLFEEMRQFDSRDDFQRWAITEGYNQEEIERVWQTGENIRQQSSTETITGMQIASTEKIQADKTDILQQGLTLQEAELYGYTNANGNHIAGTAERAAADLGLRTDTLELQRQELFGYTDENGVHHPGKYDLLEEEQKREADRLYGYQVKDDFGNVVGNVPGELQLNADRVDIENRGLSLQEARIYGYQKDDGTWVDGEMQLNLKKFGLQEKTYEDNHLAIFGGIDPTTGEVVKGELQIAAEELGLQGETLALQERELFGWTDEDGVLHKGKYDLLTEEQKMKADELYGYEKLVVDPSGLFSTLVRTPGKWEQIKETIGLQYENDLLKMEEQYGYEEALAKVQGDIDIALQNNGHEKAMILLKKQFKLAAKEAVLDRQLDWARVELEKAGFDFAIIQNQIESGNLSPDAAMEYTKQRLEDAGIEFTPPDPDAVFKELERDYKVQQYQFALTHPEHAIYDPEGKFVKLDDQGAKALSHYLNTTYYGEDGKLTVGGQPINTLDSTIVTGTYDVGGTKLMTRDGGATLSPDEVSNALRGADRQDNQNYELYQQLLNEAPSPDIRISSRTKNLLENVPLEGRFFKVGDRLMVVSERKQHKKTGGRNHDYFTVMDVATGAEKTFTGFSDSDRDSVNGLDSWASDLGEM